MCKRTVSTLFFMCKQQCAWISCSYVFSFILLILCCCSPARPPRTSRKQENSSTCSRLFLRKTDNKAHGHPGMQNSRDDATACNPRHFASTQRQPCEREIPSMTFRKQKNHEQDSESSSKKIEIFVHGWQTPLSKTNFGVRKDGVIFRILCLHRSGPTRRSEWYANWKWSPFKFLKCKPSPRKKAQKSGTVDVTP